MEMNNKGQMGMVSLFPAILALVLVGILLGVGLSILTKLGETTTGAAGTNVNLTATALGGFVTWLPVIVIVIAAGIVITIVVSSFQQKRM